MADLKEIARDLYTQERGRTGTNTRAWSDLSLDEQELIIEELEYVFEIMKETWQWQKTS